MMTTPQEEFTNFLRTGKRPEFTAPVWEGGYLIPQRIKSKSPGFINKIKRLLKLGGYEQKDLHQEVFTMCRNLAEKK